MRRWLCLFLLICLPLQLSWAVAASYCQHEQGTGVRHYGHHQHEHHQRQPAHQPLPDGAGGDHLKAASAQDASHDATHKAHAGKPLSTADNDCAACHLGALQPVPLALNAPLAEHLHTLVPHTSRGHTSHIPEGLDRPDIALAA